MPAYTYKVELTLTVNTPRERTTDEIKEKLVSILDKSGRSFTTVERIVRVDHLGGYAMDKIASEDIARLVNNIGTGKAYVARVKTSDDKRRWAIFNSQHVLYGKPHYGQVAMRSLWVSKYGDPLEWVIYGDVFEQSELAATIATIQEEHGTKGE